MRGDRKKWVSRRSAVAGGALKSNAADEDRSARLLATLLASPSVPNKALRGRRDAIAKAHECGGVVHTKALTGVLRQGVHTLPTGLLVVVGHNVLRAKIAVTGWARLQTGIDVRLRPSGHDAAHALSEHCRRFSGMLLKQSPLARVLRAPGLQQALAHFFKSEDTDS